MSECSVIEPITIDDDVLTSTTVFEEDYDEWEEQGYDLDDYVILTSVPAGYDCDDYYLHKIYKCISAHLATTRFPPDYLEDTIDEGQTARWEIVSATNAWKMFDGRSRVSTTDDDEIEIALTPGAYVNTLAMANIDCSTIDIVMTDQVAGEVYNDTIETVDLSGITDYYTWFFTTPGRKSSFIINDLPMYQNATLTITFTDTGETVTVGEVVIGKKQVIGRLQYGYSVGFRDYSTKTTDDEGNPTISEGIYSDEASFSLRLEPNSMYRVKKFLANYRATALFWTGAFWREETLLYAWCDDLKLVAQTLNYDYATLSLRELS